MIKRIARAVLPPPIRRVLGRAAWEVQQAPAAATRVLGGAARRVLMSNERLFLWTYDRISRPPGPGRARVPRRFPEGEEQQIEALVGELRRNGMAIWRGLFADPDLLGEVRSILDAGFARWEAIFREQEDSCESVTDEETHWIFVRGTKKYFEGDSRTRVRFPYFHTPPAIQRMRDDPRLREVACRYYQLDVGEPSYILGEKLSPSPNGDSWHIDRIMDQFKVMILLSDVAPEQGAMKYKLGTHQKPAPKLDHFYYQYFRAGPDYSYLSPKLADRAQGEEKLALGRPGDCIFFDTTGVHAGTRCQAGERLALVFGFDRIPSLRNRVLHHLDGGLYL
jgi:hypothetical protein